MKYSRSVGRITLAVILLAVVGVLLYAYPTYCLWLVVLVIAAFAGYLTWQRLTAGATETTDSDDKTSRPPKLTVVPKKDAHGSGLSIIAIIAISIGSCLVILALGWFFLYGAGSIPLFGDPGTVHHVKVHASARASTHGGRSRVSLAEARAKAKTAALAERTRILKLKIAVDFDYDHPPKWTQNPYGEYVLHYKLVVGKRLFIQCSASDDEPDFHAKADDLGYFCSPEMATGANSGNWFRPLAYSKEEGKEQVIIWFTPKAV
ncbi:MAG: hypothetical protein JWL75_335 [Parcubacteria group bacterium]|nr:hypothetical protein [Parcubacteria group bacterium]